MYEPYETHEQTSGLHRGFAQRKPLVFKWVCYIGFGLAMSGVLPMAACAFMFWLFDLLNCWWVAFPMFIGVLWLFVSQVCK